MYCISCGTELPDNAQFCPRCGTRQPFGAQEPPRKVTRPTPEPQRAPQRNPQPVRDARKSAPAKPTKKRSKFGKLLLRLAVVAAIVGGAILSLLVIANIQSQRETDCLDPVAYFSLTKDGSRYASPLKSYDIALEAMESYAALLEKEYDADITIKEDSDKSGITMIIHIPHPLVTDWDNFRDFWVEFEETYWDISYGYDMNFLDTDPYPVPAHAIGSVTLTIPGPESYLDVAGTQIGENQWQYEASWYIANAMGRYIWMLSNDYGFAIQSMPGDGDKGLLYGETADTYIDIACIDNIAIVSVSPDITLVHGTVPESTSSGSSSGSTVTASSKDAVVPEFVAFSNNCAVAESSTEYAEYTRYLYKWNYNEKAINEYMDLLKNAYHFTVRGHNGTENWDVYSFDYTGEGDVGTFSLAKDNSSGLKKEYRTDISLYLDIYHYGPTSCTLYISVADGLTVTDTDDRTTRNLTRYEPSSSSGSSSSSSSSSSGSTSGSSGVLDCLTCRGSGRCTKCGGSGYVSFGGAKASCSSCHQSGRCSSCGGSGKR